MSGEILVVFEHDRGEASETSYQAFGLARALIAAGVGSTVTAVLVGADADSFAAGVGAHGVDTAASSQMAGGPHAKWIAAVVKDLQQHRGACSPDPEEQH